MNPERAHTLKATTSKGRNCDLQSLFGVWATESPRITPEIVVT